MPHHGAAMREPTIGRRVACALYRPLRCCALWLAAGGAPAAACGLDGLPSISLDGRLVTIQRRRDQGRSRVLGTVPPGRVQGGAPPVRHRARAPASRRRRARPARSRAPAAGPARRGGDTRARSPPAGGRSRRTESSVRCSKHRSRAVIPSLCIVGAVGRGAPSHRHPRRARGCGRCASRGSRHDQPLNPYGCFTARTHTLPNRPRLTPRAG